MRDNFRKALENIVHFGDTDIFPFPFERYLFTEKIDDVLNLLERYHNNLDEALSQSPPLTIVELSQVGYYGFRQATLIEPFWNAYFLALVISLAEKIEKTRVTEAEERVFSYRYEWNENKKSLFKETTWFDYKKRCVNMARSHDYILQTDISNFYPRINHHKLENLLKRVEPTSDVPKRILALLSVFSGTISYGLPVGGPASRILAELALNHTDFHLKSKGVEFCRYADDYTIFCNSESDAYKSLILLSEKLANDQLGLQKEKTKIMSSNDFIEIHNFIDPIPGDDKSSSEEQKLLKISIRFDPYSPTAVEDYDALKAAVQEIDVVGILSREVNKIRIDPTVTKQAISATKVLSQDTQSQVIKILLDITNLNTLAPVFTTIVRLIRSIYGDLDSESKNFVDRMFLDLFKTDSYLTKIEMNLTYIVQILSLQYSYDKEMLFVNLFETETNRFLKRQIIVAMSNWGCHYWLVDVKSQFTTLTTWERRAVIYSSYFLNDEGRHWRDHNKHLFSKEEIIIRDWFADRKQSNNLILP